MFGSVARWMAALVLALAACAQDPVSGASAPLTASTTRDTMEPRLAASRAERGRVVAQRDGRQLVAGTPSVPAPQSDARPAFAMWVNEGSRTIHTSPGPVLGGALVDGGVVWVTRDHELVDVGGRVLDRDVIPEIAVTLCGSRIAYPHRAGERQGVYVLALGVAGAQPRRVTEDLVTADRPIFLADGRLIVVGSKTSGIAGLWIVQPDGDAQAVAVTNADLRTGAPLGPSFVPPPAYHDSMRVEGDELVYHDGRNERRVALPVSP